MTFSSRFRYVKNMNQYVEAERILPSFPFDFLFKKKKNLQKQNIIFVKSRGRSSLERFKKLIIVSVVRIDSETDVSSVERLSGENKEIFSLKKVEKKRKHRHLSISDSTRTTMSTLSWSRITEIYTYYVAIFNLSFGIAGNILVISVFASMKLFRGNPTSFYFIVESFSNIFLLISICLFHVVRFVLGYDFIATSLILCKIRMTTVQNCAFSSLYTICWSSFDQYLSTSHRYSFRVLSSMKLAHRSLFGSVTFIFLHNLLLAIYAELHPIFGCNVYFLIVRRYFSYFYYPILSTTLPIFIMMIFSLMAFNNVRRIVRLQIPIVRRRIDRQMTALVLARVIMVISAGVPYMAINLYLLQSNNSNPIVLFSTSFLYSVLYTNFGLNFYLFFFTSSRFRRQVKHFFLSMITFRNRNRIFPATPSTDTST